MFGLKWRHSVLYYHHLLRNASPPKVRDTDNSLPSLCLCISIILKIQNPHVNVVQGIISLLLKSGHAGKQVYEVYKPLMHGVNKLYSHSSQFLKVFRRLRNVSVCLSYEATLKMMSVISEAFDQEVLGWKEMLMERVAIPHQSQVRISLILHNLELTN